MSCISLNGCLPVGGAYPRIHESLLIDKTSGCPSTACMARVWVQRSHFPRFSFPVAGMASLQVDAKVLAFKSYTNSDLPAANDCDELFSAPPNTQGIAQNRESLHALFTAAYVQSHGDERPQKRRKIEKDSPIFTHPTSLEDACSVILTTVSINLVGGVRIINSKLSN